MSIVFSAITPHSPLLIPAVGKENAKRLSATREAFRKLEKDLYASHAETIVIISPHGSMQSNSFTMNLSPNFVGDFEVFGDFTTKLNLSGDIGLAYRIKEKLETTSPLQLISESKLDHGASIPLFLLTEHLVKHGFKIIPVYYSGLNLNAHYKFGEMLNGELLASKKRIAVVASGDLSHCLTKDAPARYSPKGKKFDRKLIEYLSANNSQEILNLDPELISKVSECGLKSIIILLGILSTIKHEPQLLSYEAPFGVGYLTMNFKF